MASLDELLVKAKTIRGRVDKEIENGKKTALIKRTQGFFESKITTLKKAWEDFAAIDLQIMQQIGLDLAKQPSSYIEEDHYSKVEAKFTDYMSELIEGLRNFTTANDSTCSEANPINTTIVHQESSSLPRISLPKFNGDFDMWNSFHDLFVSLVHQNPNLKPVQKLYYLKTSLVGDAERILRHVPITNEDFAPAWNKLKEGFENKRILVNHQLKRLMSQPKLNTESKTGLKELIETTEECLQQLKNLKVDTTSWDVLLIHILVQKLPFVTLRYWEEKLGSQKELPSLTQFIQFIGVRRQVLESIADTISPKNEISKPSKLREKTASYHITKGNKCPACEGKHYVCNCPTYKQMNPNTRSRIIKSAGRCLNCLSNNHTQAECTIRFSCLMCKQRHHTSLHVDRKQQDANQRERDTPSTSKDQPNPTPANSEDHRSNTDQTTHAFITSQNVHALLSTALVAFKGKHGERHVLRCLIDPGSQSSFITQAVCKRLGASCTPASMIITGVNTSTAGNANKQTTLQLQGCNSDTPQITETFFVLQTITDPLPKYRIQKRDLGHIVGLPLADSSFWKPGRIDALLGVNAYTQILLEGIVRTTKTGPLAVNTIFGWIVLGPTASVPNSNPVTLAVTTETLSQQISRFWEIEEIPSTCMLTEEEEQCQELYKTSHKRLSDGRYEVKLPFKNNELPMLGESKQQALKRFNALQRKFQRCPELAKNYTSCLNEYLELGHMEMVKSDDGNPQYYIPHHAVLKDSTTTKLRVVFDASCETSNGKSLNECLAKGPSLQQKLFSILLNWRKHKIVITGDIEKMYRMIWIHPDHRNLQRIIWQHPTESRLQEYKLKTVTFGTTSAPYLAVRTLHQLAEDERNRWPLASRATLTNFYVDDLLTGANNVTDAKNLQLEMIDMMKSGGFNLRKWASNHPALLCHLPKEYLQLSDSLPLGDEEHIKTLGIRWHPSSDNFTFKLTAYPQNKAFTKRTLLSEIASLYDPLGWLSPIIIVAKILIQELWITGCSWDTQVTTSMAHKWTEFKGDLEKLSQLKIPRWICYSPNAHLQLHGFCDASNKAYAAVVYLRVEVNNQISSTLLTSKTKVAPVKPTTIPRLELNAALILARLIKTITKDMEFEHVPAVAWTDSTIVLQWIKEHPSRWKTYVANRVVEIQDTLKYDNWHHIPTNQNPADIASRGTTVLNLQSNTLWWKGPDWLSYPEDKWPRFQKTSNNTDLEAKKPTCLTINTAIDDDILLRYSSFTRLIRVVATILRFIRRCRRTSVQQFKFVSTNDWTQAEGVVFRLVQQREFKEEYTNLVNNDPLPSKSKLLQLNPFIDEHGLLRVGGRLQNANINFNTRHPLILPRDHHVTRLLIDKIHKETMHGGCSLVLATSRQKFWILDARRVITSQIHRCITCARHRKEKITQLMGNLPDARVNVSRPFSRVGIDYAGPITIKTSNFRKAKQFKAYFCIFVCMATRAVHIEPVSSLASEAFLAALKRFVSRRGLCTDIFSDCGTNFVGGKTQLERDLRKAIAESTPIAVEYLSSKAIRWHFNPPAAPHFGGIWEAGVKSIKYHLRRSLGNAICTFEELTTILTQIECCLNSRPLSYISNDPNDIFILTPGHFLIGEALNAIPEPDLTDEKLPPLQRWKHLQQRVGQFWKNWSRSYLHQLQNRPKWLTQKKNLKIGDIVLIQNENAPPTYWPLGKVEQVYPGKDGLIRVVQVRTQNSTFKRPVSKLSLLPVESSSIEEGTTNMEYYAPDGVLTILEEIYFSPPGSPNPSFFETSPEKVPDVSERDNEPSTCRNVTEGSITTHTHPCLKEPAVINGAWRTNLEVLRVTTTIKEFHMRMENTFQRFLTKEGVSIYLTSEVNRRINPEEIKKRRNRTKTINLPDRYQVRLRIKADDTMVFSHYHKRGLVKRLKKQGTMLNKDVQRRGEC